MHADIKGCLSRISDSRDKFWMAFEHNGVRMSREQVLAVLQYADKKGYETTAELKDSEVDEIIQKIK